MRVLLDTCVLSEIIRPQGSQKVKQLVSLYQREAVYLNVVTIGELARGIALLDPGKKREHFASALLRIESDYAERILSIDLDTGRIWGEIDAARKIAGRPLPIADGLIAATALRHGLHVVTRNVKDFSGTGVLITNPWENS